LCVYPANCTDFSNNGMGVISPSSAIVKETLNGSYELAKDSARTGRLAWYGPIEDARKFFQRDTMEQIVKSVNRVEEGGDGLADDFVMKYAKEVA